MVKSESKKVIKTYDDIQEEDWTCPNCNHQSPSRAFEIFDLAQEGLIDEINNLKEQNRLLQEALDTHIVDQILKLKECLEDLKNEL
jgi:Ca2+-binding EF-hand superfamily protein